MVDTTYCEDSHLLSMTSLSHDISLIYQIYFDFSQKGVGKGSAIETVAPQYLLSSFYPLFVWLVIFFAVGLCPITSDVTEIKLL